jgi:hypothetical protein
VTRQIGIINREDEMLFNRHVKDDADRVLTEILRTGRISMIGSRKMSQVSKTIVGNFARPSGVDDTIVAGQPTVRFNDGPVEVSHALLTHGREYIHKTKQYTAFSATALNLLSVTRFRTVTKGL